MSDPNPFEAFYQKLRRHLAEMAIRADSEFRAIEVRFAPPAATAERMADALSEQMGNATDWALAEAVALPFQPNITRKVVLGGLTSALKVHLNDLTGRAGWVRLLAGARQTSPFSIPPTAALDQRYSRISDALDGALKEFEAGVWRPSQKGAPGASTSNTVNINGSFAGTLQQAGAESSQQATFTPSSDDVRAAIDALRAVMESARIDAGHLRELEGDIATIEAQLGKARPDIAIMRAAAWTLSQLAFGVAGGLLTPPAQALLHSLGLA
jgi:hypothetical protein